ncbi:hypothetical protein [Effusibacillus dendaii]|uniref:Uncharacterized protein n=1 Tax=Effusibacillus dendaii TaxID=2743772 RepID=A0A7I8DC32_9BACL|nr:hypothetical protein [Effusibacillus dendaii]BCJ87567.1 hypothetical protein skT53_25520 [Effusibacillus dendaii]
MKDQQNRINKQKQQKKHGDNGNKEEFERDNVSATVSPFALDTDAESAGSISPVDR